MGADREQWALIANGGRAAERARRTAALAHTARGGRHHLTSGSGVSSSGGEEGWCGLKCCVREVGPGKFGPLAQREFKSDFKFSNWLIVVRISKHSKWIPKFMKILW